MISTKWGLLPRARALPTRPPHLLNELVPTYSANLLAQTYDALKEWWPKLNSYLNASVFSMLTSDLKHSELLTQTSLLSDKMLSHAEHFQMTNRILCHKHETLLKLNFFPTHEAEVTSLLKKHFDTDLSACQLDAQELKNGYAHATKRWNNALRSVWIQLSDKIMINEHDENELKIGLGLHTSCFVLMCYI